MFLSQINFIPFRKKCNLSRPGVIESLRILVDNDLVLCEKFSDTGKLI